MQCDYYDAGVCLSCTLMEQPYGEQVQLKQRQAEQLLEPYGPTTWLEPFTGPEQGYRTRIKMVVGGTFRRPTFGILDRERRGVDLRECGVIHPDLTRMFGLIHSLIRISKLAPYSVPERTGELKQLHMTLNEAGQIMLRFVVRSRAGVAALRPHLAGLLARAPHIVTVTANLLPDHVALAEGDEEIHLAGDKTFPLRISGLPLRVRPQGFVQTNQVVAEGLYAQAGEWVATACAGNEGAPPETVWDLYAGVGGFGFTAAQAGAGSVIGVETSDEAVAAGNAAAAQQGMGSVEFIAADATQWVREKPAPELIIVNPPRRGLGPDLPGWLNECSAGRIIYSSCNPTTLARDLAAMDSWKVDQARLFDMFPQTPHMEVIALLSRI